MLKFDKDKLQAILRDFYELTKIKVSISDEDGVEQINMPHELCDFCKYVRTSPKGYAGCKQCDKDAHAYCKNTGRSRLYTCHMGLMEYMAPIVQSGVTIGYLAFGQSKIDEGNANLVRVRCKEYRLDPEIALAYYNDLEKSSLPKVEASVTILNACSCYLHLNRLIEANENLNVKLSDYITEHLADDLSVEKLCKKFYLSRMDFYDHFKQSFRDTPMRYIRKLRLSRACELLRSTSMPITTIAQRVGIGDYNYFTKVFKAYYGISPREYRKRSKHF